MDIAHQLGAFADIVAGIVKVFGNMPSVILNLHDALVGKTAIGLSNGLAVMSSAKQF